jgi:hypothetical protein
VTKALFAVRYVLPALLVIVGFALIVANPSSGSLEGGMGFIGAGIAVFLLNALIRMGAKGDLERTREDDARAFFAEHGHWPDETPEEIAARAARRGRAAR